MTDSRDALPLHGRGGRVEGACPAEEQVAVGSPPHFSEKVPCKHYGTASAAGPTGMDILGGGIEEKDTAVVIAASQVNAIPLKKSVTISFPRLPKSPVTMRS